MEPITRKEALSMSTRIMETAERERRPQPTKEEVGEFRDSVNEVGYINNPAAAAMIMKQKCLSLCDAYLALMGEVERKSGLIKMQDSFIMDKSALAADRLQEINRLEAENQALRERLTQVEQVSQRIIGNMIGEQKHETY